MRKASITKLWAQEEKYQPMFNTDLIYDEEIFNKFDEDIKEIDENNISGINLIQAINKQDNYYQVI